MVTLIFLRGLCGYVWVNILTLSPPRGLWGQPCKTCSVLSGKEMERCSLYQITLGIYKYPLLLGTHLYNVFISGENCMPFQHLCKSRISTFCSTRYLLLPGGQRCESTVCQTLLQCLSVDINPRTLGHEPFLSPTRLCFRVALVCLYVCLFIRKYSNITQQVMNGLQWNFMDGSRVVRNKWLNFGGNPALATICAVPWLRFSYGTSRLKLCYVSWWIVPWIPGRLGLKHFKAHRIPVTFFFGLF